MRKIIVLFSLFFISISHSVLAQQAVPNESTLTIEQIMQGEKFVGYLPSGIHWSEDSKTIYFSWNPDGDTLRSTYKIGLNGETPMKLSTDELKAKPSRFGTYNKAGTKKLYSKSGDLFLMDVNAGTSVQITNTNESERNPQFSGDEQKVIFQKGSNLFSWDISLGVLAQLTDFRKGKKRSERKKKEYEAWLERDQMEYFDILQKRKETREVRERRNDLLDVDRANTVYFGDKSIGNIQASPDLKFVTYRLTKDAKSKGTKVPSYVTESGYIDDLRSRSKVGTPQNTYEFGIYDLEKDSAFMLDIKSLDGIYDKPAFLADYHKGEKPFEKKYKKPRQVIVHNPIYADDGKAVVVIRSSDNKDRWICLLDLGTQKLKLVDKQHDDAWIGGPGISSWNFSSGNIGWLADNETLYYQSEEPGYSHIYTYNTKTGKKKALTKGDFEIRDAYLSKDKQYFYINANKVSPHEQHFYRLSANGGKMTQLTSMSGKHEVSLSPDEKWMAIRYSFSNKPWELYLQANEAKATPKQLTKSTTSQFNSYSWREPEIVKFTAEDGAKVPARLYRPANGKAHGGAVIFVHGAGYLQNVHKWWSSYYREYMFHNLLTDNGFTVLDIDYRASDGYGRDWRTGIYQFMGGKDLDDQVDGAKYLVDELDVDPKRIGIYGGSYGGFITMMGLFTKPGTFKSGAALRSVTDWAHYNHGYTSNILNTPVQDSIAYYKSSPIYHAEGLQDQLLILHGVIDRNVQFQDVVRLAQRLIELGKDNWEFAVFPLEGHGFVEASSWADEYKRIYKLFQQTLTQKE